MKYYKAIAEKYDYFTGYTTIPGELVTQRERDTKFRYIGDDVFQQVEISKSKVFWSFGTRFEIKK